MTEIKLFHAPDAALRRELDELLARSGLRREQECDETAVAFRGGRVVATGARRGGVLQYIAVLPEAEGEGLSESIVSRLTESAVAAGIFQLFLCTKPAAAARFLAMGFCVVAETAEISLLENSSTALSAWLSSLPRGAGGRTGAIVAHLNPFTRGHLYLLEQASRACGTVHLFVLSEEGAAFSPAERLEMARQAAARFPNVLVHPGGRYIISSATFPAYFLKDASRVAAAQQELDAALFARRIAPALGITLRFVGTEPFCAATAAYNDTLRRVLPRCGIELREVERLDGISASAVRALLAAGRYDEAAALVPEECRALLRRHAGNSTAPARNL